MPVVKEVQVTLYDVFGFVLPGTVVLAAGAVLFCFVYLPAAPATYTSPDLAFFAHRVSAALRG
jgi:hypothetical protein